MILICQMRICSMLGLLRCLAKASASERTDLRLAWRRALSESQSVTKNAGQLLRQEMSFADADLAFSRVITA